ncbi:MAG: Crp/Fnr family transcriptional regulator [Bdellovibrionales bacterium]
MDSTLLQNVYLFRGMDKTELNSVVEICTVATHNPGDTIFMKGEQAKALYLIKHGSVKIQQTTKGGDTLVVATLGTGSHFGEMSFVDGEARSATAVAGERTEVIAIPYDRLKNFLTENKEAAVKFYRELSHFLCGRLRMTTTDLNFAREKNLSHF